MGVRARALLAVVRALVLGLAATRTLLVPAASACASADCAPLVEAMVCVLVAAARALFAVMRTLVLGLDAARLLLLPAASARASAEGQLALLATGGSRAGELSSAFDMPRTLGRGGLHARRRGLLLRFVSAAALVVEAEASAVLGQSMRKGRHGAASTSTR